MNGIVNNLNLKQVYVYINHQYFEILCNINFFSDVAAGEEGHKQICVEFDNIQISCMAGICRNVSAVYQCTFEVSKIKPDFKSTSFTKNLLNLINNSSQCTVRGSN